MFELKKIWRMHAWLVKDDIDVDSVGFNSCLHGDNNTLLSGHGQMSSSEIGESEPTRKLFLVQRSKANLGCCSMKALRRRNTQPCKNSPFQPTSRPCPCQRRSALP